MNVFIIATFFWVLAYRFFNPAIPQERLFKNGLESRHRWISYENLSREIKLAVVVAEDKSFLYHKGFDFNAIRSAYIINKRENKTIFGASTITQQTAKNVFLWKGKSWLRKALEAYFTVMIELLWSKERVLEVYLNVIQFGDNIYGIKDASEYYFSKQPKDLNLNEASILAAILPNPKRWFSKNGIRQIFKNSKNIQYKTRIFFPLLKDL